MSDADPGAVRRIFGAVIRVWSACSSVSLEARRAGPWLLRLLFGPHNFLCGISGAASRLSLLKPAQEGYSVGHESHRIAASRIAHARNSEPADLRAHRGRSARRRLPVLVGHP